MCNKGSILLTINLRSECKSSVYCIIYVEEVFLVTIILLTCFAPQKNMPQRRDQLLGAPRRRSCCILLKRKQQSSCSEALTSGPIAGPRRIDHPHALYNFAFLRIAAQPKPFSSLSLSTLDDDAAAAAARWEWTCRPRPFRRRPPTPRPLPTAPPPESVSFSLSPLSQDSSLVSTRTKDCSFQRDNHSFWFLSTFGNCLGYLLYWRAFTIIHDALMRLGYNYYSYYICCRNITCIMSS